MSAPLNLTPEQRAEYLEEARSMLLKAKASSGYSQAATWAVAHGLYLIELAALSAPEPALGGMEGLGSVGIKPSADRRDLAVAPLGGWQLVPTKHDGRAGLTHDMCAAFWHAYEAADALGRGYYEATNAGYNAMLRMAPSPPADVAPEARATAQSNLSAEGAQQIDKVNRKPTEPNLVRSEAGAPSREAQDYYPSHETLHDLVSLLSEHDALNGGGPGWDDRWKKAVIRAEEIVRVEP